MLMCIIRHKKQYIINTGVIGKVLKWEMPNFLFLLCLCILLILNYSIALVQNT